MKATMRCSGKRMFYFHVKHSIGSDDLERAVIEKMISTGEFRGVDDTIPKTRAAIAGLMRYLLKDNGQWSCGAWDDITKEQRVAAEKIVRAAFPELY